MRKFPHLRDNCDLGRVCLVHLLFFTFRLFHLLYKASCYTPYLLPNFSLIVHTFIKLEIIFIQLQVAYSFLFVC